MKVFQQHLPHNFSPKYRNPCWYSSLQIPHDISRYFSRIKAVHYPMFDSTGRAEQVVKSLSTNSTLHRQLFCLPSVYIAAFPKCGTTALYNLIVQHPKIAPPITKEGHFWSTFVEKGDYTDKQLHFLWYLHRFKGAARRISSSPQSITIDGSPSTLWKMSHEFENDADFCIVPSLIANLTPSAKFIVIMRNPVERLFSDFWFFCSHQNWVNKYGRVVVPKHYVENGQQFFHNITADAIHQFHSCVDTSVSTFNCVHRATVGKSGTDCFPLRLGIGMYYYHIIRWLASVSIERFLFLRSEDLTMDPYSTLQKMWRFLNLTVQTRKEVKSMLSREWNSNDWIKSERYRDRFAMLPETEAMLREFYRPHNQLLAQLLSADKYLWEDYVTATKL